MLRNLLLTIGIVLAASLVVFPQTSGTLQGKVLDKNTKVMTQLELEKQLVGGMLK